jgi:uncharacterized repeat protein (TIGR03803 family)
MKRDQVLSVSFACVMQPSMSKLRIALVALTVALVATGAHADPCYSKSSFNAIYDFGDHAGDPLGPQYVGVIAQGRDGNLWSTTPVGGKNNLGTAFRVTPGGKLKVIYNFTSKTGQPYSGLTLGTNGNFYGTTYNGGTGTACTGGCGTVFELTPSGKLTILWNFEGGNNGENPYAPPIEGTDGNFYGTAYQGGANNLGTIYQLTPSGKLTTMYQFASSDGANPVSVLVQGTDGNLYGTTLRGGGYGYGAIFKIAPSGSFGFTLLFSFDASDGAYPYFGLVQGSDSKLYGTAANGASGYGDVFYITTKGSFTERYPLNGGLDGAYPVAGLVEATDGNFYGAAQSRGNGYGTFFRITPKGKFTVCEDFNATDGATPLVTPIQHTNGKLYGDTYQGGDIHNTGVFYYLNLGLKPFVSLLPPAGKVGATVEFLGQGFTGTKAVSFNGTAAAKFTVVSDTYMTAVVPTGATAGFVTVATPKATLQSNKKFRVTE